VSERRKKALERTPVDDTIYTVYLDSGSFTWLMEILTAKTRTQQWVKPYQALVKRTLLSFEEAAKAEAAAQAEAPLEVRRRTIPRVTKKSGARTQKR